MPEPHPRWARATSTHVERVREALLSIIETTGKPLPGGVTAYMVKRLPDNDLLDLAKGEFTHGRAPAVGQYLDLARTLPPEE